MSDRNRGKVILIVEDNKHNMELAADLLEVAGFTTLQARNGENALKILADNTPHVVLLDLRLPDVHGLEIFRKIRENKKLDATKVIVFTASAMKEEEEKIRGMGFDAFISKPIDTTRFVQAIEEILHQVKKG